MCGIVGVASPDPVQERQWLVAARDVLRHRGPDDAGEWWSDDGRVGLAHRRLAIIDLSPSGRQPMADVTGELRVVFNGEIYNFRELRSELETKGHGFHSRTDTEVILAAYRQWGLQCLSRLNGMFAFCLFDLPRRRLFLARDRAGEKPLFYSLRGRVLRFASELKALMADPHFPRRLDPEALDCYLAFGFIPGSRCILQGVRKLPPAHALLFDLDTGAARVWRYWMLPAPPASGVRGRVIEDELIDECESLLEDSVRRQLVADVPVGVMLSGGMDSSLVTAMAARARSNVKTFTVRFPGYGLYDETDHARFVANHFSTEHIELDATAASPDLLLTLAHQFDEPIADPSMIPTFLLCQAVRRHCTVALGGDGGDELFGGYIHYPRLAWLRDYAGRIPLPVRHIVASAATAALPVGTRGRSWLQALGADMARSVPLVMGYFDPRSRSRLVDGAAGLRPRVAERVWEEAVQSRGDLVYRATRADFHLYLAEDILVKVDRASMFHSLEVRAPFLDCRIVEFAFGRVPSRLKASSQERKLLLKALAVRVLPPGFDAGRKQGFGVPLDRWLISGPWRLFFREVLLDSGGGVFDRRRVEDLLNHQVGWRSNSTRLFSLVFFELWRQEHKVAV
ncbi:MAG: asparagine synthase (glutamine-hydrolyzing) [Armatimonadota bacterium]|nr:asparagine synthase (glutamine-hydrolyzing) [Armatimonadota bacterium]